LLILKKLASTNLAESIDLVNKTEKSSIKYFEVSLSYHSSQAFEIKNVLDSFTFGSILESWSNS
jgi:hypothetical protein